MDSCLHPLSDFVAAFPPQPDTWDYCYEGRCPRTGQIYSLPRTALAKAVAQGLMDVLATDPQALGEGKMYGVLLVQIPGQTVVESWAGGEGQLGGEGIAVLKAFSGLWRGQSQRAGWVPPIPGREQIALLEAQTLDQLHRIKTRLQHLKALPERDAYTHFAADFDQQRQALNQRHRQRREHRAQQRHHLTTTLSGEALVNALAQIDQASRCDKAERRALKQRQAEILNPLGEILRAANIEMQELKRQRRAMSQRLQTAMHMVYRLTNFAGDSLTLAEIQALEQPSGLPTGTGDCCAPKLLHYAAQQGLQPLALAEFWWGPPLGDRQSGQFYRACEERCQPILGFLLAGLSPRAVSFSEHLSENLALPILYLDDWLVAVDKPAGLLSVPGRYGDRQDSVLSRLWLTLPEGDHLRPVHRLDQATSGVLLLARHADSHRYFSRQFAQRRVAKIYEALLEGTLSQANGWITLPRSPDPHQPPRQQVDWQQGKASQTYFEVITGEDAPPIEGVTRVEMIPHTGRTHQLRVHAAHPQGLNAPILGDTLYGHAHSDGDRHQRLYLHAKFLTLPHPQTQTLLTISAQTPF